MAQDFNIKVSVQAQGASQAAKELEKVDKAANHLAKSVDKAEKASKQNSKSLSDVIGEARDGFGSLGSAADTLGSKIPIPFAAGAVAIAGVTVAIAGATTAAYGLGKSIFELTKSTADYGSAIYDATQKTGLSAETISALKLAADQGGTSLESVTAAVGKYAKKVGDAATGSKEAAADLKALGVDPKDAIKDLDGSLAKVFQRIQDLPPGIEKITAAQAAFGKSGQDLLPFIDQFSGDLPGLIQKARELGVVMSDADAAAADEFGDTLVQLETQIGGVTRQFGFAFMPTVTRGMQQFSGYLSDNQDELRRFAATSGVVFSDVVAAFSKGISIANQYKFLLLDLVKVIGYLDPLQGLIQDYVVDPYAKNVKKRAQSDLVSSASVDAADKVRQSMDDVGDLASKAAQRFQTGPDSFLDGVKKANAALGSTKKQLKEIKEIAEVSFDKLLGALRGGTAGRESGGRLGARNPLSGALSLFQVMPENVPEWTRNTPGVGEMTAEEFRKNAVAQVKVFNKYMGGYLRQALVKANGDWQKAIRMAAAAWYGGPDDMGSFASKKPIFFKGVKQPTFDEYTSDVLKRVKKNLVGKDERLSLSAVFDLEGFSENLSLASSKGQDFLKSLTDELNGLGVSTKAEQAALQLTSQEFADLTPQLKEQILLTAKKIDQQKRAAEFEKLQKDLTAQGADTIDNLRQELELLGTTDEIEQQRIKNKYELLRLERQWRDEGKTDDEIATLRKIVSLEQQQTQEIFKQISNRRTLVEGLRQVDDVLSNLGLTVAGFGSKSDLEKFDEWLANPDVTKAIEERAKAIGWQADALKDLLRQLKSSQESPATRSRVAGQAQNQTSPFEDGLFGSLGMEKIKSEADFMKGIYGEIGAMAGDVVHNMAQGVGDLVNQWVLYGDAGPDALRKMTAAVLGQLAAQAAVESIMELARGFAALANPFLAWTAPLHFKSAALFAAIGVGAAAAGRLAAGNTFKQGSAGGSSSSQQQPDYYQASAPQIRESSQYFRTNNPNAANNDRVAKAIEALESKISSMPAKDVVSIGVKQNRGLISDTTISELKSNGSKATQMGKALRMS